MFVIPRLSIKEISPLCNKGWRVVLAEGRFVAQVVILFEDTANLAEADWHGIKGAEIPTYVKVEAELE